MPILIAQRVPQQRRQPELPRFGVYYTLSHVAGRSATIADLVHALTKLRRSDVIRWLCAISGWLEANDSMAIQNQLAMANVLLSKELCEGLDKHRRSQPGIPGAVFHRRQIWLVLQMALLVCKEETAECPDKDLGQALGSCCLMANEILNAIEPKEAPGQGVDEINTWMATTLIPLVDIKDRAEIMARAQSFWFDLPASDAIRQKLREMGIPDFNTAFNQRYGLPLRDLFLAVVSMFADFGSQAMRLGQGPLLLDQARYRPCFTEEALRQIFTLVAQSPDQLALKLLSEPRQNWAMDSTPLRQSPVIEVFPGRYTCPDRALLYRWLVDGLYFLLQKAYSEGQFSQLFGYVFEEYVNQLVRQFSVESDFVFRTFYASPKFQGTSDQAGDGLIHRGDTALLMEYKARLLTTREKYSGVREATIKGIDDIVYKDKKGGNKGVAQLASCLARLLKGEQIVARGSGKGLDLSTCPHIFPAIVTYEPSIALEAVRQRADAKLRNSLKKDGVEQDRVGPLLLFCVDDIEAMQSLALKHDPRQVIHEYVGYLRNRPDRTGSFRSYLNDHRYERGPQDKDLVLLLLNRAVESVAEEMQRRGAPVGPPSLQQPQ